MHNAFVEKLERGVYLTPEDRSILIDLTRHHWPASRELAIARRGERNGPVYVLLEGIACRAKMHIDGRRQISAIFMPGDFCNLQAAFLGSSDHDVIALSNCKVVQIPYMVIHHVIDMHPRIRRAFLRCAFVDESILLEWNFNIARRSADERMAHLFCELLVRSQLAGVANDNSYEMPLKQIDLALTLGMSAVHINRTLNVLRSLGLISLKSKRLSILDISRTFEFCRFDPTYLHFPDTQVRV